MGEQEVLLEDGNKRMATEEDKDIKKEEKKKSFKEKIFSREVITYVIAGVLTTLVNLIAKFLFLNILGINENVTTALAWVVAVSFAYVINNYWVFLRGNEGTGREIEKIIKFTLGRIATYIIEAGGIYLFVTCDWVHYIIDIFPAIAEKIYASPSCDTIKFWIVQLPLQFLVIVFNYIFSKLFVFVAKKNKKANNSASSV
ncbi:MAG: GtrA family protein [Lachnospiraceae bacterium]|nr:GtrA family protein [Lachnospiraceae bacterium]